MGRIARISVPVALTTALLAATAGAAGAWEVRILPTLDGDMVVAFGEAEVRGGSIKIGFSCKGQARFVVLGQNFYFGKENSKPTLSFVTDKRRSFSTQLGTPNKGFLVGTVSKSEYAAVRADNSVTVTFTPPATAPTTIDTATFSLVGSSKALKEVETRQGCS